MSSRFFTAVGPRGTKGERRVGSAGHRGSEHEDYQVKSHSKVELTEDVEMCREIRSYICLTSVTRAKPKEKNEICRSISTHAVKCDGVFFILQHGFQYGFQHA